MDSRDTKVDSDLQAVHSFSGPLNTLEDLFGPCGTKLGYKEPSWTFIGPKRDPHIYPLLPTDSTKYQCL